MAIRILSGENITGDISTSGKVNAGDRILTEATTSNALLQVKYNASNYLEAYYDTLNVEGGDFLIKRAGDTKITLTAVGTTFTNLSNTSAASSSVDEVKIGTFGAGRPAIFLGSSNTTYTNSTWFIENIGASGKFRIGRNGLDILEIENSGASTFKAASVTVLNASDPSLTVSDTDTNYRGTMRFNTTSNVLEFVTRYASTYYTKNLVLDRGKVGIGTYTPSAKLEVSYDGSHTSGDISYTQANIDVYNPLQANTDEKGSIITFTDNYFDGTNYPKTTRAAIKGGTDTVGNTANGFLAFYTDSGGGNSATERMRINSSGDVGIGVTDPGSKLEVTGDIPKIVSISQTRTDTSTTLATMRSLYAFGITQFRGGVTRGLYMSNVTDNLPGIQVVDSSDNSGPLSIQPFGGNVGIGVTDPRARLNTGIAVEGSLLPYLNGTGTSFTTATNIITVHNSSALGTNTTAGLMLINNNNSNDAPSPLIAFSARSTSNTYNHTYAAIWGEKDSTGADTNWNTGSIIFATSTSTGPYERMRINPVGNVGIGTDSISAKLTLADHTTAAGGIKFRSAASAVSLWSSGSGNLNTDGTFNAGGRIKVPGGNAVADPDFGFSAATAGTGFSRAGQDITFVAGGSEKMRLRSDGNFGVQDTNPLTRMQINGCLGIGSAVYDGNISRTFTNFSQQPGGSLHINIGMGGGSSSGDTVTFEYAALSWKSWSLVYNFASTAGITYGVAGGYWNGSGGSTNQTQQNNLGVSVAITHNVQSNIITFTFTNMGTHAMANFVYMQSGGDGQPIGSRVTITATS